jgi:hypothetical protein
LNEIYEERYMMQRSFAVVGTFLVLLMLGPGQAGATEGRTFVTLTEQRHAERVWFDLDRNDGWFAAGSFVHGQHASGWHNRADWDGRQQDAWPVRMRYDRDDRFERRGWRPDFDGRDDHGLGDDDTICPIPEPGQWAMLAAGLLMLVGLQKRRRSVRRPR